MGRAVCAILVLTWCAVVTSTAQGRPSLTSYSPTQGTQGTTVTLTFTGINFSPRTPKVLFTPSQGLTVASIKFVSPVQIVAQVQIASTASTGSYQIDLQDADHDMRAAVPFTVIAAQQPGCPPTALAACAPASPTIKEMTPVSGKQGTTVLLTLSGANFAPKENLQLTPSTGLTIGTVNLINANQVQASITIAATAPLGPRSVTLVGGNLRTPAPNTFTVTPAANSGPAAAPMQILRLVPSQITAGSQNVDVAIEGTNFVAGTQITFSVGAGIPAAVMAAGPARYVNSTEIHVTVSALATALPGGRDITLATPEHQQATGRRMLDVLAPTITSGPPPALKITPINLQTFSMGKIVLDSPQWGDQYEGEIEEHYGIPELDDDARFQWHEQNPGLADYYVLNIYAQDGVTLLGSKQINGGSFSFFGSTVKVVPTYYRPDAAFLAQVLEHVSLKKAGYQYSPHSTPTYTVINGVKIYQPPAPTSASPQLAEGDLQWEVVGYHTYNTSGVAPQASSPPAKANNVLNSSQNSAIAKQVATASQPSQPQTTDIKVEVSNRWPLNRPKAPTGMACSGGMGAGLQAVDIDKTGNDPNYYAGDRFVVTGNFNLTDSPYAAHPNLIDTPGSKCSNCLIGQVGHVAFDNLFVDWGDGTIQSISAVPADPNMTNWNRGEGMTLPAPNPGTTAKLQAEGILVHPYNNTGTFIIRVFQLSEADAQHVNAALLAASIDGPGGSPFLQAATLSKLASSGAGASSQNSIGDAFHAVLEQGSNLATTSASSAPAGPDLSAITSRAYMIFCTKNTLTVPEDLAADGPLHLKSIADPTFPGHDNGPPKTVVHPSADKMDTLRNSSAQSSAPVPSLAEPRESALGPTVGTKELKEAPKRPGSVTANATCSTCDDQAVAESYIGYYGHGPALITWNVDGVTMQQPIELGPSQARKLIAHPQPGQAEPQIIVSQSKPFDTPSPLSTKVLGMHSVSVQAELAPDPTLPNLSIGVHEALGKITGGNKGIDADAALQAQSLLTTLSPPAGSNLPPLKIGILSSSNQSVSGLGAVQYVNEPLKNVIKLVAGKPQADSSVASAVRHYEVVQSDPSKPCKFLFPVTSGGAFEVEDIQGHITQQGTKYSGSGNLIVHLANKSSNSYDPYPPIPITFTNWDVADGAHVDSGTIDISPGMALLGTVPGVTGTIDRIQGHTSSSGGAVQGEVDATLSLTLADDTLRLPGVEKPQTWSGLTSELHANGDWIKNGLTLPSTMIGWSAFQMQSNNVRIDLSHNDGDAADPLCGGLSGGDWVGVRFPALTITPYTMGLVQSSALQPVVTDWGVVAGGLCGSLTTGPFHATYEDGTVGFQSLSATAAPGQGDFTATYHGMDIYVPWLDTHITGDGQLQSGGGNQATITFPSGAPSVTKTYGNIAFTAKNLQFTQVEGLGWAVKTSTTYTFNAKGKTFTAIPLTPFYFGMNGHAYLANGASSVDVPLGGSSTLDKTPVDLVSAHIAVPFTGDQIFTASFSTNVHLSEVMADAPMQVNYELDESGTNISEKGPTNSPFTIDVPYPSGQPSSDAKVHPVYSGSDGSEYSGSVDLSELGGPPITAQFRLGYGIGHDYWLTRAIIGLGDTGIPIVPVPPIMNLYSISGGMGHNFPLNAFTNTGDLNAATPVYDNSFLFYAGMRVGMPDHFTYTLDGDLTIKATGQNAGARMDFHAWLLKPPDNDNGDFQGYFQYAGGNFDGRLWGQLSFMNGLASLSLGNSANNAAVDLHFGNGPWHIDAGKKEGPRIQGHFLVSDANMYVMLSDQGLAMGGGINVDLDVGDSSVASAYVKGDIDAGVAITPQPHISGDFSANASAGVCVSGVCVSDWVSAQIHAEAMPLDIDASASIGLPWPLGSVSFSVHL
ncbi:MAG: IPT/TIG domain-containing protein [Terracidiphilus sp.]